MQVGDLVCIRAIHRDIIGIVLKQGRPVDRSVFVHWLYGKGLTEWEDCDALEVICK